MVFYTRANDSRLFGNTHLNISLFHPSRSGIYWLKHWIAGWWWWLSLRAVIALCFNYFMITDPKWMHSYFTLTKHFWSTIAQSINRKQSIRPLYIISLSCNMKPVYCLIIHLFISLIRINFEPIFAMFMDLHEHTFGKCVRHLQS